MIFRCFATMERTYLAVWDIHEKLRCFATCFGEAIGLG